MASRYNHAEYDVDQEYNDKPDAPPTENLASAAAFVANLFHCRGIAYGLMGGFALNYHGSRRGTRNVDIAHEATMATLWKIVEPESRLIIPQSRLIADVMKIFVRTGPGYDRCTTSHTIEVDLKTQGSNGSPRYLRRHLQTVKVSTSSGEHRTYTYSVLDVRSLLRSKLHTCAERGLERDFVDMDFILKMWPVEAREYWSMLDPHAIASCREALRLESKTSWASPVGPVPAEDF